MKYIIIKCGNQIVCHFFNFIKWNKMWKNTLLFGELGRFWWFLIGDLGNWVIFDEIHYLHIWSSTYVQHSDMERTVSTTQHPLLWTLDTRDLEDCFIFRVLYHLQMWLSISMLSSTFQHANKCIRNPLSSMLDLDEVDGSWLET